MTKNFRYLAVAAVGAVVTLGFSSCAYDPYYSTSVGGSYRSGGGSGYSGGGYGDGYGYGGSSFTTSFFVGTGDSQWGYDPECYSYYDYQRRCYYDPYLNGYYPVGYRPQVVYGAPHPYGWHRGGGYISPPQRVRSGNVVDYRDRESSYRNSSYGWAKQVRPGQGVQDSRSERGSYERGGYERRNSQNSDALQRSDSRMTFQRDLPQRQDFQARQDDSARPSFQNSQPARQNFRPSMQQGSGREQSRYNSPVSSREQAVKQQVQRAERPYSDSGQQPPQRSKYDKVKRPKEDNYRIQDSR